MHTMYVCMYSSGILLKSEHDDVMGAHNVLQCGHLPVSAGVYVTTSVAISVG